MSSSIRNMQGIGPQAVEAFEAAGFHTIAQLKNFDGEDRRLWSAILTLKEGRGRDFQMPMSYWRRLMTRCINIIYRARSAEATDFVPHVCMCPLSLDWYEDPVVTASGISYSRASLEEWLETSSVDPVTRVDLSGTRHFSNIALRNLVDKYRLHFQRFKLLD